MSQNTDIINFQLGLSAIIVSTHDKELWWYSFGDIRCSGSRYKTHDPSSLGDVWDESLPFSIEWGQQLFAWASILLVKNLGTDLVRNRLYSRPLTNLLIVDGSTPSVRESLSIQLIFANLLSISKLISMLCSFVWPWRSWFSNFNVFFSGYTCPITSHTHIKNIPINHF